MTDLPHLLVFAQVPPDQLTRLEARHSLLYAPTPELRTLAIAEKGEACAIVLTTGAIGLSRSEVAALPALELICSLGAGVENIDFHAARERSIVVANGAGTNTACVADHAMALLLAGVRQLPILDHWSREGRWRDTLPEMPPGITRKKLGIAGFGLIGQAIARRATAFDMEIAYSSRRQVEGSSYRYFAGIEQLAEWSDCLIVAMPGGRDTHHLVSSSVLEAIGPKGLLINIARGTVVDTVALAGALRSGALGAAALDVWEGEPHRPDQLIDLPNVMLTPHVAGWSPEAMSASVDRFLANVDGYMQGTGVISPVC